MNDTTQQACPMSGQRGVASKIESTDWALGPGSLTWQVVRDPSVFMVGMLSTSLRLPMHPAFAATGDFDSFATDPVMRFKRIILFVYMAAYGTVADATKVAKFVIASHTRIKGVEPTTGLRFQANSEYELAMTLATQTFGFLATYEKLHGELSLTERDQFVQEQKVLGAVIGINPEHASSSYYELLTDLEGYRKHFAVGEQGRDLFAPFDSGDYPKGTVMGDLPFFKRKLALTAVKLLADMAFTTMLPEDLHIMAINRKPVLKSRLLTRWAFLGLSRFMESKRGRKMFEDFMGEKCANIYREALAIDRSTGHQARRSAYVVPDPNPCFFQLPDLVKNWPGSPAEYKLGGINGEVGAVSDKASKLSAVAT